MNKAFERGNPNTDHRSAGHRRSPRKAEPYAWLGVGALTAGLGVALVSGSAVAFADTDTSDTAPHTSRSVSATAANAGPVAKSRAAARHSTGAGTAAAAAQARPTTDPAPAPSRPAPALAPSRLATAAPTTLAAASSSPNANRSNDSSDPAPVAAAAIADAGTAAAAELLPDDRPSLRDAVIIPGSSVTKALGEISDARAILRTQTWGAGKPVAGLWATVPDLFLAEAAGALTAWQNSIEGARAAVGNSVGVPLAHQVAQLALLGTLMLPTLAGVALDAAALTIPVVGVLGAPEAADGAGKKVASARQDALVYAVIPFRIYGTNEIAHVSINGGTRVPVEIDSGSSGLTITQQYVKNLGQPTGGPYSAGYGNDVVGVQYAYQNYAATVKFANGVVTGNATLDKAGKPIDSTIDVVTPDTQQAYNNYQYGDGVVGVLGIGANAGPGPNVNVTLPGELKDGVLEWRIGRKWGLMVLGPNPLPVKKVNGVPLSVDGAPITETWVQINGGPLIKSVESYIDSGGVHGDMPAPFVGTGQTSGELPVGTRIAVYAKDGKTLLYKYTTTADNTPTVTPAAAPGKNNIFNTGIEPFRQGPIYTDYSPTSGDGSTKFDVF